LRPIWSIGRLIRANIKNEHTIARDEEAQTSVRVSAAPAGSEAEIPFSRSPRPLFTR